MPEKDFKTPSEIPPVLPDAPEMPLVAGEEQKTAEAVRPLPPPAPLLWRAAAYLLDWALAGFALLLLLRWVVPMEHPDGPAAAIGWFKEIWASYSPAADPKKPLGFSEMTAILERTRAIVENPPQAAADMAVFIATVQSMFFWAFFTITEFFTAGASLGKKIGNLRVASGDDYGPPRFFDSLVRSAWKAFFYCSPNGIFLLVGIIDAHVPLFNVRRRSWHDMFSRTEVIDARYAPLPPPEEENDENDF